MDDDPLYDDAEAPEATNDDGDPVWMMSMDGTGMHFDARKGDRFGHSIVHYQCLLLKVSVKTIWVSILEAIL